MFFLVSSSSTIRSDLKGEFLVVGTLLDTILVNRNHDVADRGIDGIDSERSDRIVLVSVLITGHVSASLVDGELNLKVSAVIEFCKTQIGIKHLEVLEDGIQLTCDKRTLFTHMEFNGLRLFLHTFLMQEAYLLEVEDKVGNVSDYTGDRSKFMINTTDLDRADGVAFEATQQYATDRVAYRDSIPRLERAKLKDTFVRARIQHYHLVRFDEI